MMSHLGRPKGKPDPKYSLKLIVGRVAQLVGKEIKFADDDSVTGDVTKNLARELKQGEILLLQNTRFRKEEEKMMRFFQGNLHHWGMYMSMMHLVLLTGRIPQLQA